jgi:CheY-like chemotaxis protein
MTDTAEINHKVPKILIADDDPSVVRLLAERCANVGFEVETASNGIQALLRANRTKPDALIIDINMPKADGFAVCERLMDPARNSFEVVVVTGSKDQETIERCESLGAFYTHKGPDFWDKLASALAQIFPAMADKIKDMRIQSMGSKVRKRPRVLVIDDDAQMEAFFSSRLGKYGVEMLYAHDAAQGYRIACNEEPSVILCDYYMPNGDALYLLSRLRTTRVTENIPVFILTGRRLDESAQHNLMRDICGHRGAARIFRKSFDTSDLFGALQQICGFDKNYVEQAG